MWYSGDFSPCFAVAMNDVFAKPAKRSRTSGWWVIEHLDFVGEAALRELLVEAGLPRLIFLDALAEDERVADQGDAEAPGSASRPRRRRDAARRSAKTEAAGISRRW